MSLSRLQSWSYLILLVGIIAAALFLRGFHLDARTIHIDEGVSFRYGQMLMDGEWRYSPDNAHGPVFFLFSGLVYRVFGDDLVAARAAVAAVSIMWLLFLLRLYWHRLRPPGRLLLAAGIGLSSGMAFTARYFIHEHIFIFWTVCALAAAEWWLRRRDARAPAAFLLCCVLMYATKETALLTWAAWGVAAILLLLSPERQAPLMEMRWKSVFIGLGLGLVLYTFLFTQMFRDNGALLQSVVGPLHWSQRAQQMHLRPFWYFPGLLLLHEFPLVLGACGAGWLLTARRLWNPRLTFFALWTVFIVLAYSVIPYKTPWCIPNLILPLGLFAAFGIDALWPIVDQRQRWFALILSVFLLAEGSSIAWQDSIVHPDRVLPYDYAYLQSDRSLRRFIRTLEDLSTLYEGEKPMPLQRLGNTDELLYVLTKPYRSSDSTDPPEPGLPVYIKYIRDDRDTLELLRASGTNYIRSTYMYLRDFGSLVDLFVEESLWNRYLLEVAHEEILPGENPLYDYSRE